MIALGELIKSLIMPFLALLVGEMNDDASIMNNDRDHVSNDGGVTDKMIHTCPMYARIRWLLVESRGGGPIRSKICPPYLNLSLNTLPSLLHSLTDPGYLTLLPTSLVT